MKRRQCQAFSVRSQGQCPKNAMRGTRYCWHHYPRKDPVLAAGISIIAGLILAIIFSDPMGSLLARHWPFYIFLDHDAPVIVAIDPDIRARSRVVQGVPDITLTLTDQGDGLDTQHCLATVYYCEGPEQIPVQGASECIGSTICFTPRIPFVCGRHVLKATIADRAGNLCTDSIPFMVREEDDLEVKVTAHRYESQRYSVQFGDFVERHSSLLADHDLYVLHLFVGNNTHRGTIEQLHFMIFLSGLPVFDVRQGGLRRAEGANSYRSSEVLSASELRNRESTYTNQHYFWFKELSLGGGVHYLILAGKHKGVTDIPLVRNLECYGTYTFAGYGITEVRKFQIDAAIDYQ